MKLPRLFLLFFPLMLCATAAAAEMHPAFDFAAAERNADFELKRKPEPAAPKDVKKAAPAPAPACPLCKDTGRVPCPQHRRQFVCMIAGITDACKVCRGLGYIPCPVCKASGKLEAKQRAAEAEAALNQEFTAAQDVLKDIDQDADKDRLGTKVTGYVTQHIAIASNLSKIATLACAQHAEALLPKLDQAFQGSVFSFTSPQNARFYLLDKSVEYKSFLDHIWKPRFPSADTNLFMKVSGTRAYQVPSLGVTCYEHIGRNQDLLVHDFIHMYSHILLNRVAGERFYVPWIEEGFAAWAETLELSAPRVYCIQYDFNKVDLLKNRTKILQAMVRTNKAIPMEKLSQITFMDMKAEEYFESWSMVSMLIERDPAKFIAFLNAMPEAVNGVAGGEMKAADQEKALKDAYGYDFPKLLAVWKQYVIATVR